MSIGQNTTTPGVVNRLVGPALVAGVIGVDVHAVGNKILEYALRQAGFQVTNLGIMVSQEEFVQAAIETGAEAILVSSLYGHGEIDCRGLRQKCTEAGLDQIRLYVGGNLVVGDRDWHEVETIFREMGFDRIGPPGTRPTQVLAFLREDLGWPPLDRTDPGEAR
jgi:methylaspartate mutase sigma subunit